MPKRPISRTIREHPEALPDAAAALAAGRAPKTCTPWNRAAGREATLRKLLDKYGDPLEVLAKAMIDGATLDDRAAAAAKLARYIYPELKATEISGSDSGAPLVVEIRKS